MATNGNTVCSYGLGQARYLATLPASNDRLVLVILQAGHQDDDILRDYETVAALLAGAVGNKRCTAPGYADVAISSGATSVKDDTNNRNDTDIPDLTFPALGAMTGTNAKQEQAAVLVCYLQDAASTTDANLRILSKHYYPFVADGRDTIVPFPNGFYRAAGQ